MRLDAYLSRYKIQPRSMVKLWIKKGDVTVNACVVKDPSMTIDPNHDVIAFRDETITYVENFTVMMNKRAGVVSARKDTRHTTVFDDLSPAHRYDHLSIAGRLDKDTEGLIILSTDGDLIHQLTHPKKNVFKTYLVVCDRLIDSVQPLLEPMTLLDGKNQPYTPQMPIIVSHNKNTVELKIKEGKFHQVKRMFQAIGHEVVYLKRTAIHHVILDATLNPGQYRMLTEIELAQLRKK